MKFRSLGRLALAITALACLFAAFSATAFGAGKPSSVQAWGEYGQGSGPNQQEIGAQAIPNGYPTTLSLEYREAGTSTWLVAKSAEIGSGVEPVQITAHLFPIEQRKAYEIRATATNSIGSVTSAAVEAGVKWDVGKSISERKYTSAYSTSGTLKIEWEQPKNYHKKIECSESGAGEFGPEASNESLRITPSNCSYYIGNEFQCNPSSKNWELKLNKVLQLGYGLNTALCEPGGPEYSMYLSEPFVATLGSPGGWAVAHPMTLTAKGLFGASSATFTISSNWELAGPSVGKMFRLVAPSSL
jgi:hypothetical protein